MIGAIIVTSNPNVPMMFHYKGYFFEYNSFTILEIQVNSSPDFGIQIIVVSGLR